MSTLKKGGLGRGLNALFEDEESPAFAAPSSASGGAAPAPAPITVPAPAETGAARKTLPVSSLRPGKFQPRKTFDEPALIGLSESIASHGILQPLLVRPLKGEDGKENGQFEIIGGERRWRAAQKAQLHDVPVIIKELDDEAAMEISLIDNLQRDDLDAIEEAEAYQRLMEEFAHTQDKLSKMVGKSRSHIANTLRLLNLPQRIQEKVRQRDLSAGHARALITARDPEALMRQVMDRGLSVRETERLAAELGGGSEKSKAKKALLAKKDADTLNIERDMTAELGMKVSIDVDPDGKGGGKLVVKFKDMHQLDKLMVLLRARQ